MDTIYVKGFEDWYVHKYYIIKPVSLMLHTLCKDGAGYIVNWTLMVDDKLIQKSDIMDLIFELMDLNDLCSEKERIIIYTDDLTKLYCYLVKNIGKIDQVFRSKTTFYYFLWQHLEFRDIHQFYDDKFEVPDNLTEKKQFFEKLHKKLNNLTKELWQFFIKNKMVYLTPTQVVRKQIKKGDTSMAKSIFPKDLTLYKKLLKSYTGGICVCNYPGVLIDDYYTAIYDRKSAYIFDLLMEKHACEPLKQVEPNTAQFYIDNEDIYFALMRIKINITRTYNGVSQVYRDYTGNRIDIGEHIMYITNTDFNILKKVCYIHDYECLELYISKKDYLPEDLRSTIEQFYYKKLANPSRLNKKTVNSIYGACVKKISDFVKEKDNAILAPQWGILTASYARRNLLHAAMQLESWAYSDTDSIICRDSPNNKETIKQINAEMDEKILQYCNKFDKDYNQLKDIGKFELKDIAIKFKANSKKQYMYTKIDGEFVFKGSGINGKNDESAYDGHINTGRKNITKFNPNETVIEIEGNFYRSNGSYYSSLEDIDGVEVDDDYDSYFEHTIQYLIVNAERRK